LRSSEFLGKSHVFKAESIKQSIGTISESFGNGLGIAWEHLGTNGKTWDSFGNGLGTVCLLRALRLFAANSVVIGLPRKRTKARATHETRSSGF
jgi:hypothetical protein